MAPSWCLARTVSRVWPRNSETNTHERLNIEPTDSLILVESPAAWIHVSIGSVQAGTAFAIMQSLTTNGILAWLMPLAGAVGLPGLRGLVESICA